MLALALLLSPQAAPAPRPILVEAVAAQCGDSLITSRDFERTFDRYTKGDPPSSREDAQRKQHDLVVLLATLRLEEEAGEDLGVPPEQLDLMNRHSLRENRERAGLQAYLAELEKEGKDAHLDERDSERRLLRYLWEYSVLGNGFAGRRPTRDQTIRPGELRILYSQNRDQLAPVRVQMRVLVVATEAAGGAEAARAACVAARERVLAGEDLALIVEEVGNDLRDSRGLLPYWPLALFQERLPDLAPFARDAEIGDLSEVLPLTDPRTGRQDPELGYQLAQLFDREDPEVPQFETAETQQRLRTVFANQRREALLARERERLRRDSYLWLEPALAGEPPPAPAPDVGPSGP